MKARILKAGLIFVFGIFFAACGKAKTTETPTLTSRPKPLISEPATPTPTLTLEQDVLPEVTITNTPTPEQKATSTPVPTKKPTRTPTPTIKPTATPEPENTSYQKGILSATGFESKWMGLKFSTPQGVEMYTQEELDETMRLLEEALYGELPDGKLKYEELVVVYEMSAIWQTEGLLIQLIVEALLGHKALMGTLFHHMALIQHQNVIRRTDGGQAVGDHKAGFPLHQRTHRRLDMLLCTGIHVRGGLIQNQHMGIQ